MTKKSVRNDIFGLVMLNEVKHPRNGFLADARNDIFGLVMLNEVKHPRNGFLADARNDIFGLVMLNEVKHPPICHAERSEASILDSSLTLGMTSSVLSC
jgi:hypothetical protein